ncbi:MAG: MBL fold metallo-hydrolase [Planctomycetes bacterium]|nr:MBL fold metallo-hydrolase [Planctomycetota bacterium]
MLLEFHGATRSVTGSMHVVEVKGQRVLLDCGLFQGHRKEAFEQNRNLTFDPRKIHGVVLSHAHIDHSGNLPQLAKAGFTGPIYCTRATQDLCRHMLCDAAHIQEKDVEYVNKKRRRDHKNPFEPLYTIADADACLKQFQGLPYDHPFEVGDGMKVTFRDAGHILGSASVHLDLAENGLQRRLVFTGDIGRPRVPILRDPVPIEAADLLISESTYGNRLHDKDGELKASLRDALSAAFRRRGKVLIPAFSVGRTQTIVYYLHQLCHEGTLPPVPVFVDSPLSTDVTAVFRQHPECYDQETLQFLERQDDPFGFRMLTYIKDQEESKALNERSGPFIIIAASGMCESGRVLHHLKHVAPYPENAILIVGFMAENTLGRRIAEKAPAIKLYGEEYPLRAEVRAIPGFSGHADQGEILRYLGKLRQPPQRTFLVHGEPDQSQGLAAQLQARGFQRVDIPARGQRFEIN